MPRPHTAMRRSRSSPAEIGEGLSLRDVSASCRYRSRRERSRAAGRAQPGCRGRCRPSSTTAALEALLFASPPPPLLPGRYLTGKRSTPSFTARA